MDNEKEVSNKMGSVSLETKGPAINVNFKMPINTKKS